MFQKRSSYPTWQLFAAFLSTIALAGAAHDSGSTLLSDGGERGTGTSCTPLFPLTGGYGCCPYERGDPCTREGDRGGAIGSHDLHSCCPQGFRCLNGTCFGEEGGDSSRYAAAPMETPRRRQQRSTSCSPPETVKCQDGSTCPEGNSCCHTPEYPVGTYSCCRYPYNPVCCPDGSCCNTGYRCEPRWGICVPTLQRGSKTSDNRTVASGLLHAVPARRGRRATLSSVKAVDNPWLECPDGSFCHRNATCCAARLSPSAGVGGSRYACCPHREAQCCQDEEHCCPRGTRCVQSAAEGHRCQPVDGNRKGFLLAFRKYPSIVGAPGDTYPSVPCPTWMVCDSGSCCQDRYGAYRCSPYAGGVCCASGISGCPPGTECVGEP